MDEKPFLVDTGKTGMGGMLLKMIKDIGLSGKELDFVMVSHGHEDHDGSLAENEVISHCELLIAGGDVVREKDGRFTAAGSTNFESHIQALDVCEINGECLKYPFSQAAGPRSSVLYCMASATWNEPMCSRPSRSAMVQVYFLKPGMKRSPYTPRYRSPAEPM